MTKAEAKRYVYRCAASLLLHHITNGSECTHIDGDDYRNDEDIMRIEDAIRDVAAQLEKKAGMR